MTHGDPFARYTVDAHGGDIQEQVDDVVVQQVHLVDVQHSLIDPRQDARPKTLLAVAEGMFQIQGAQELVFGDAQRQRFERRLAHGRLVLGTLTAVRAPHRGPVGGATVATARVDPYRRQQAGQRACRCTLGRTFLAADQHAPQMRVDGDHLKRQLQLLLPHERRKREHSGHLETESQPALLDAFDEVVVDHRVAL